MMMRIAFAVCGIVLTITVVIAALQDFTTEWGELQREYIELAISQATDPQAREAVRRINVEIKQDFLPQLNRTDRCRTCHLGIDNPNMADAKQPFTTHPGSLLESHPPERFGCTVCHQGQGLATTTEDAHANLIRFWEEPMLPPKFIEASCEQCHRDTELKNAAVLNDGRAIFEEKGCAGCHQVYGKGGPLGPALTDLGRSSPHVKPPTEENRATYAEPVAGDINLAYILEAIADPEAQPETTTMPRYELSNWELNAMAVYVKGLSSRDFPAELKPRLAGHRPTPTGRQRFVRYCSACHGADGEGGYRIGRMGTALNNEDFLALASRSFVEGVVVGGRNSHNKVMPAWREGAGGLSPEEITGIVDYVMSWAGPSTAGQALAAHQLAPDGDGLFQRACADCHGPRGEGKIGPSLTAPELFQIASERFFDQTLDRGRPGTAMPAWPGLSVAQRRALIAFIRQNDLPHTPLTAVSATGAELGQRVYWGRCATCHGRQGEGGIGPSLNTPQLAALADEAFFATTLVHGRLDAGMPAWSQLDAPTLSGLVAHLQSIGRAEAMEAIPAGSGDLREGKTIFDGVCSQCHGRRGEGGTGPAIGAVDFTRVVDDRFIAGMIKYGRDGTEMRPHGLVRSTLAGYTDQEIMGITGHLRTLGQSGVVKQTIRGSVAAGESWYRRICVNCHGARGQGATGPALANPHFLQVASDGFLQAQMALGRSGTEMRAMTPYAGGLVELDRAKINDVIAFIRHESMTYGREGQGPQTAFGSVDRGGVMFEGICARCHGKSGRGTVAAPGLNDKNFLQLASDGFLQGTMIRGRMHTGMRAFGQHGDGIASLSAQEITDVTSYMRSWINPHIGVAQLNEENNRVQQMAALHENTVEE